MSTVPKGGVYGASRKVVPVQEKDLYVPPFLGPDFFQFLFRFIASPATNPMFLREWRRNRRRLGPFSTHPLAACILLALLLLLMAIPFLLLMQELPDVGAGTFLVRRSYEVILFLLFFGSSAAAGLFAFFSGLQGSREFSNPLLLEELRVTPLKPQEIVFGYIAGGLMPMALLSLPLLPAFTLVALDLTVRDLGLFPVLILIPIGTLLWFFPNVLSAMLASGAIASCISFGEKDYKTAATKALGTWLVLAILVMTLPYLLILAIWPYTMLIGVPLIIAIRLIIAGSFLHHMVVKAVQREQ